MKTTQSKKLKLNVTNIKSSLFSYGKQPKKIRSDRKSLFAKEESENKKNEKENKIESPLEKIKSIGSNIKQSLIAGPMSILDKIKEFLTIVVIGLLVNNLPKIIERLKKFFGNNPWILDAVKWTIKTIGKGILGFIDLVNNFSKFAGGTYATIAKTTQDIKKQIDGLGNLYNNAEKEIKDLITTWTLFFNPKQKPSAKAAQSYARSKGKYYSSTTKKTYTSYAAALKNPQVKRGAQQQSTTIQQKAQKAQAAPAPGYDPNTGTTKLGNKQTGYTPQILAPLTTDGKTTMGAMEPGKPNTWGRLNKNANLNPSIQRYNAVSQEQKVQKFSIGGTIKNFFSGMFGGSSTSTNASTVSSSRSNAAGTSARPETRTLTVATSPFARPGGTAKGRKAIQSVNYFGAFNKNTKNSERNTKMSEENTNKFEDITERLKAVNKLKSKLKDDKTQNLNDRGDPNDTGGGGGGGGGLDGATVFEGNGVDRVWNFFKGKTLSDIAVSGIMGNAQQESGFNPTIAHSESLQGSPAKFIGIFQWDNKGVGDRWGHLVKWAKSKKLDPENIDTQLRWTWEEELGGSYRSVLTKLKAAKTPEEAAKIWYEDFEVASHGLTERQNYAKGFYKKYKGKLPKAITKVSQGKLPPLPPTGTESGQYYGADRDDDKDGIPDRKHAGVDYDISGNDKFYSRIGGQVIRAGFRYGDDGYGVDIYNSELDVTERIAEARQVLVKVGDIVKPGREVVQGESGTGVIHYEIRKGKNINYTYEGTVNPSKFLQSLNATQTPSPVAPKNLSPLTTIIQTMQDLKQNTLQLGDYTLTLDGNKLKVNKKGPLGVLDFLGLFGDININKDNLDTLNKLKNDILYYQDKKNPGVEGQNAASIKPIGKTGDMVASLLNTKDPNDNTNYVLMNLHHTTVVKDTQTIAMKVPVYVQESGSSDSTSSIFSEVRSLLG